MRSARIWFWRSSANPLIGISVAPSIGAPAAGGGPEGLALTFNRVTMLTGIADGIGFRAMAACVLTLLSTAPDLEAQRDRYARGSNRSGSGAAEASAPDDRLTADRIRTLRRALPDDDIGIDRGRFAVLVDLDVNRLYFLEGETVLWSAPVGTGTGMRVITDTNDWEFSTPTGRFQVEYKELDPVWIAPDWYFVENNLPVPEKNHESRYMQGTLGAAAVYISPHLAIHGTNRPELIGQRVSHGCIRLENRYAMRLYHNVQIGTEVLIVGGDDVRRNGRVVDLRDGYDPSLASRGGRSEAPVDAVHARWKEMETPALFAALDRELAVSVRESRWDEVAVLLLGRAKKGDEEALLGLLRRSTGLPTARHEREWTTLLADAYRRATLPTLRALSRLGLRDRRIAAESIVSGMLTLYPGDFASSSTPWPSSRIPANMVSPDAERGWRAILAAERSHRDRVDDVRERVVVR